MLRESASLVAASVVGFVVAFQIFLDCKPSLATAATQSVAVYVVFS